jgi:hypothetical protein
MMKNMMKNEFWCAIWCAVQGDPLGGSEIKYHTLV